MENKCYFNPGSKFSLAFENRHQVYFPVHQLKWATPKSVKLYQVEARLQMSRSSILGILSLAGYKIPNNPLYDLTFDHLIALAKAYEKSIKQFFKRTKKQIHTLDSESLKAHADLFRLFIHDSNALDNVEIFDQILDSYLIESWVLDKICSDSYHNEFDNSVRKLLKKLKFKILTLCGAIRTQIFLIILSHHYHVFPSEEGSSEKFESVNSFSKPMILWIRKAIIEFKNIKAFRNDRYTKFSTTYTTV